MARLLKAFGQALRDRRNQAGLSQMELSLSSGLSSSFISQIENGLRGSSLETIDKLAKALGTTATELVAEAERRRRGNGNGTRQ